MILATIGEEVVLDVDQDESGAILVDLGFDLVCESAWNIDPIGG